MAAERKFYLDWLRVGAFGMLILFHVGMLYVPWPYNIKSARLFPGLEYLMIAISPWRMALLFFVSGVASYFLLRKLGPGRFTSARVRRLLVVVLVGMIVINPVQVYVEFLHKHWIEPGYLAFWLHDYLPGRPFPSRVLPTWDHLWFLLYLLAYSLLLALFFKLSRWRGPGRTPLAALFVLPGIWLCTTNVLIHNFSPVTDAFFNDWANHLRWFGLFVAGVLCAGREDFWEAARRLRRRLLWGAMVALALQIGHGIQWRREAIDPAWGVFSYGVIEGAYGWIVTLTLLGYAREYLNHGSRALSYLTDAVLPIYVVHQPILLVAAYLLFPVQLPVWREVSLLVFITGAGSLAFYEGFVRRWPPMRFLFGLRQIGAP